MQLDFKYELKDLVVKCKNRDMVITNKLLNNNNVADKFILRQILATINYYCDNLRYYSFGFIKKISRIKKIPAYYTYNILDMQKTFHQKIVIGEVIKYWDVSNVKNMHGMLAANKNKIHIDKISNWDVGNVTDMTSMFLSSKITGDIKNIKKWNVSNVMDMGSMFCFSKITGNIKGIGKWNVSKVKYMVSMFASSDIDGNIGGISEWNVSEVRSTAYMFYESKVTGHIRALKKWNVINLMRNFGMFRDTNVRVDINADMLNWRSNPHIYFSNDN